MGTMKIVSWNIEHLDRLTGGNLNASQARRRDAIVSEIEQLNPDILCVLEGPKGEAAIDAVAADLLGGRWTAIKAPDGVYDTSGTQWIWFLVRTQYAPAASLQPTATWDAFAGKNWPCCFWGRFEEKPHHHYRHPQVLVLDWSGTRVEFVGVHLKAMFVNGGQSKWEAGGAVREGFIREALDARVKMTTEASNVRSYIDAKFAQVARPAIFVMGDFNDGPGKEYFEERYLFFDLLSNIQGDVFFATRFLNHALFDFPDDLRWTVKFKDFVQPERRQEILLDHIMFTQSLTDGSLPWQINAGAGKVEHEIHSLVNAPLKTSEKTSDHAPISVIATVAG